MSQIASHHDRVFGAAVVVENLFNEPDLRSTILQECGVLTPEIELKWDYIEPMPSVFSFDAIDKLCKFAAANGMRIHGHTLLWHKSVPAWVRGRLPSREGWPLVRRYFEQVLRRFGDSIGRWDVVNEPIETGGHPDGLRRVPFIEAFGVQYIERAFWQARQWAPRAELMINEFGLEYKIQSDRERRYFLLKLLERLKQAGTPLDGVGLQSHLDLAKGPLDVKALTSLVRDIADLGLFIVVSELDVKEHDYALSVDQRDKVVADEVRRYLDAVLGHTAVRGVFTWGLSDRHSWLKVLPSDLARYPTAWRDDGSHPGINRGLPFDSSMRPKPMYQAIADALRN